MQRQEEKGKRHGQGRGIRYQNSMDQDVIQGSLISQWRRKANLLAILAVRANKSDNILCWREIAPYLKRDRNQRAGFALLCFCSYQNHPPALIQFHDIVQECSFTSPDTSIQRRAVSFPLHLPIRRHRYFLAFSNSPEFLPHLTFSHS